MFCFGCWFGLWLLVGFIVRCFELLLWVFWVCVYWLGCWITCWAFIIVHVFLSSFCFMLLLELGKVVTGCILFIDCLDVWFSQGGVCCWSGTLFQLFCYDFDGLHRLVVLLELLRVGMFSVTLPAFIWFVWVVWVILLCYDFGLHVTGFSCSCLFKACDCYCPGFAFIFEWAFSNGLWLLFVTWLFIVLDCGLFRFWLLAGGCLWLVVVWFWLVCGGSRCRFVV